MRQEQQLELLGELSIQLGERMLKPLTTEAQLRQFSPAKTTVDVVGTSGGSKKEYQSLLWF
jgi:hypothetical protein